MVSWQGVAGHVHAHPGGVAELYSLFKLLPGEVAGGGAHTVVLARKVYGVGTVAHGGLKALHVPGGS